MFGLKNYVPTWVTSTANSVVQNNPSSHEIRQNAGYHASSTSTAATNLVVDTGGAAYSLASNFSPLGVVREAKDMGINFFCGVGGVASTHIALSAAQYTSAVAAVPGASALVGGATAVTGGFLGFAFWAPLTASTMLAVGPSLWFHREGIGEAIGHSYNITADTLQTAYHAPSTLAANVQAGVVRAAENLADDEVVNQLREERAKQAEQEYTGREAVVTTVSITVPEEKVKQEDGTVLTVPPKEHIYKEGSDYPVGSVKTEKSIEFHHILTHEQNDNYDLGVEDFDSCEELVASIQREEALYENPEVTTTDGFASALEAAFARGDVFSGAMEEALGATPTPKGDEVSGKEFDLAGDLSEDFGFEVM